MIIMCDFQVNNLVYKNKTKKKWKTDTKNLNAKNYFYQEIRSTHTDSNVLLIVFNLHAVEKLEASSNLEYCTNEA